MKFNIRRADPYSLFLIKYSVFVLLFICYGWLFWLGRDFIPEKWVLDSFRVQENLELGIGYMEENSFGGTALFFYPFRDFIMIFVFSLFCCYLWIAVKSSGGIIDLFFRMIWVVPCLLLCGLAPLKETVVLALAVLVVLVSRQWSSKFLLVVVAALYFLYAFQIRTYFFLILILFFFLWFLRRKNKILLLSILGFIILGFFIPSEYFAVLQGQRDIANHYAMNYAMSDNRTMIFNPMPPVDIFSFLINYGYVLLVVAFPFFLFVSVNEILLVAFVYLAGYVFLSVRRSNDGGDAVIYLFAAHFLVLILFEPDLGSFMRHISSVSIYLAYPQRKAFGVFA